MRRNPYWLEQELGGLNNAVQQHSAKLEIIQTRLIIQKISRQILHENAFFFFLYFGYEDEQSFCLAILGLPLSIW